MTIINRKLHSNSILHRNINPSCVILIPKLENTSFVLDDFFPVVDDLLIFNSSKSNEVQSHFAWGFLPTAPPETGNCVMTEKADIWGIGSTVCYWVTSKYPESSLVANEDYMIYNFYSKIPRKYQSWMREFLMRTLQTDVHLRASCSDLIKFISNAILKAKTDSK